MRARRVLKVFTIICSVAIGRVKKLSHSRWTIEYILSTVSKITRDVRIFCSFVPAFYFITNEPKPDSLCVHIVNE